MKKYILVDDSNSVLKSGDFLQQLPLEILCTHVSNIRLVYSLQTRNRIETLQHGGKLVIANNSKYYLSISLTVERESYLQPEMVP